MGVLALTGLGLLIGLPIAASVYLPGEQWLGIVGLIPIAGAAVCYWLFRRDRVRAATVCFAGCAVVLVITLVAGVAQRVDRHQRILVLVEAAFERSEEPQFASFACLEPSWVHYCRQNIHEFPGYETREAREFLGNGAVSINGRKITDLDHTLTTGDLLHGRMIMIRRGKKKWHATQWG